jgi:hypothetical protein
MDRDIEAMFAALHEPLPPDTRSWEALWGPYAAPPQPEGRAAPEKPVRGKALPKSKPKRR